MNKQLVTAATLSIILTATPAYAFMRHLRTAGTFARHNWTSLSLAGLAIVNYKAQKTIDNHRWRVRAMPGYQRDIELADPIIGLGLAFGAQDLFNGEIPIINSIQNLRNLGNDPDRIGTFFKDGGKLFTTTGSLFKIYRHFRL